MLKQMKRCSTELVIGEIQIKTMISLYTIKMSSMKSQPIISDGEVWEH